MAHPQWGQTWLPGGQMAGGNLELLPSVSVFSVTQDAEGGERQHGLAV